MMCRGFAIACCMLVLTAPWVAQSDGAQDPISGAWAGEFVTQGAPSPQPVTFQLIFDGKSAVSGTVSGFPNPGDVKKGIFDSNTGALTLELGTVDDSAVLLVLEGTVAEGVASGRFSGLRSGKFRIMKER